MAKLVPSFANYLEYNYTPIRVESTPLMVELYLPIDKKEIETMYTVKVKNGDYGRDPNTGQYGSMDLLVEFEDLSEALHEFLNCVISAKADAEYDQKVQPVTLTFKVKQPKKGKK